MLRWLRRVEGKGSAGQRIAVVLGAGAVARLTLALMAAANLEVVRWLEVLIVVVVTFGVGLTAAAMLPSSHGKGKKHQ